MYFIRLHFLLIVAVYLSQLYVESTANEHVCSPFDYNEKLLENMIRTEIKFEQLLDDIEKTKETMASNAADMSKRVEAAENSAVKLQGEIEETVANIADDLERTKEMITTAAEAVPAPVVAFNARMSSSQTAIQYEVFVFDTILTNEGEGYDSGNGMFTAPHSGLYSLNVHMCNEDEKYIYFAIVVKNKQISSTSFGHASNSCSTLSTVAIVNSSERVWVRCTGTSYIYTDEHRWITFTGVLLNK